MNKETIDEYQELQKRHKELRFKTFNMICEAMEARNWHGMELTMKCDGIEDIVWFADAEPDLRQLIRDWFRRERDKAYDEVFVPMLDKTFYKSGEMQRMHDEFVNMMHTVNKKDTKHEQSEHND